MILQNAHAPTRPKPAPVPAPAAQAADARRASPAPATPEPSAQASPAQAAVAPVARPEPPGPSAPAPQATPVAVAAPKAPEPAPASAPTPRERKELVALRQDAPVLSPALLREHPSGTVKIGFEVKPDGSTGDVKVLASTNRRLNHAAVVAVEQWRFQPIDETRPIEIELVFSNE